MCFLFLIPIFGEPRSSQKYCTSLTHVDYPKSTILVSVINTQYYLLYFKGCLCVLHSIYTLLLPDMIYILFSYLFFIVYIQI